MNGEAAASVQDSCVSVLLVPGGAEVCVELTDCRWAENRPREELKTELLTRVQCSNARKAEFKRILPIFVQKALRELDVMDYTVNESIFSPESEEAL